MKIMNVEKLQTIGCDVIANEQLINAGGGCKVYELQIVDGDEMCYIRIDGYNAGVYSCSMEEEVDGDCCMMLTDCDEQYLNEHFSAVMVEHLLEVAKGL